MSDPHRVKNFLRLKYYDLEREIFSVTWVDSQNRVLAFEDLAVGTLNAATIYPREVTKAALRVNAAAAIFSHKHPSGTAEPNRADRAITERLREALKLIDIRTLDHLVVGGCEVVSFAERGWL